MWVRRRRDGVASENPSEGAEEPGMIGVIETRGAKRRVRGRSFMVSGWYGIVVSWLCVRGVVVRFCM